jgi:ABC-type branched-subunit amino acid transport system substrate-binding protein
VVRARSRRLIAGLVGLALVVSACGGTRSEDASSEGSGSPSTTASSSSGGSKTFGDLPSPCGPAEGGAPGAVAPGQQGITDTSIHIGYGDDAGFQGSPGLNHQMTDAVEALMEWCNEQGGINGRTVEGTYYDAKILDANNAMTEACAEVAFMVGTGWALDGGAEQTRVSCELPLIAGFVTAPTVSMGPAAFAPIPQPVDRMSIPFADSLAKAYPDIIKKATTVFADFPATRESKDRIVESFPAFGWEFLDCPQQYAISGESGWAAIVQRLKDCGAEAVYFTGAADPNFKNLLDAAAQADYEPVWFVTGNFTEESFSAWNTSGFADNVYINNAVVLFDQAADNPATQQYLDLVEEAGGDVSTLGAQAASAFLLWATAAQACGDDISRQCVVDELTKTTSWTGGGLHAETNPGGNVPSECGSTLRMQGTKFEQWSPKETGEWDCSPDYVVEIVIPAAAEAKVGPDRKSKAYTS